MSHNRHMKRAIFVTTSHEAGCYWARQWGYEPTEVLVATPYRRDLIDCIDFDADVPAFLCGETAATLYEETAMIEIIDHLQARGYTILDAQEMGGEMRPVVRGI